MEIDAPGLALAAARWLTYLAAWTLIGAGGASLVLARVADARIVVIRGSARRELVRLAMAGALLWLISAGLTLVSQLYSWFGSEGLRDLDRLRAMISGTVWGHGWSDLTLTGAAVLIALLLAARWAVLAPFVLPASAIAAAWALPLIGHGASHGATVRWLHTAHVAGGGLWLGTLFAIVVSTRVLWRDDSPEPASLQALLAVFTPVALGGAFLAVGAGMAMMVQHVAEPMTLARSSYGQTLLVKLLLVLLIALFGWRNWRRSRPRVEDAGHRRQLRRDTARELSLAAIVLALSALLSNLPMPM